MPLKEIFLDRKFVVTGGALFLSLLLFVFFPGTDRLPSEMQSIIAFLIFFLLFPLLYAKFILGESWRAMGFQMEQTLFSWILVAIAVACGIAIFFFGYQWWSALHEVYRLPFVVERSFLAFVRYELFLLVTLFFYEVFFRGFVQLLFLRRFGGWSVLLQWGIFLLFLFASQSFGMDQLSMILFAPFAGWVAYRSQSIWFSFLASGLFFIAMDVFLLLMNR